MKSTPFVILLLTFIFASCIDGNEEVISNVEFTEEEILVKESDVSLGLKCLHPLLIQNGEGREIVIELSLDKPLAETSVIQFSLSGTAKKNSTENPVGDFDYVVAGDEITIEKGATSVELRLRVYEDFEFEFSDDGLIETVKITLIKSISGSAKIGSKNSTTLKIVEDDAAVILDWDVYLANSGRTGVDMDIIMKHDGDIVLAATATGDLYPEILTIPPIIPSFEYGLCYTYYSGNSNFLLFNATFYNFGGMLNGKKYGLQEVPLSYTSSYTLNNLNHYTDMRTAVVAQTITKDGPDYSISALQAPSSGSRITTNQQSEKLKADFGKQKMTPKQLKTFIEYISK